MLAKLIRLDLRFAYKKFLTMAALILLLGIVAPYAKIDNLSVGLAIVFTVTFAVIPILCVWLVVQHFERNLFGHEGYLMFSLPVSASQLLLSKLITTLIWFNLMLLAAVGFIALLLRVNMPLIDLFRAAFTWDVISYLLKSLLLVNANALPIILAIFMGIALSTVAVRNRKLGTFWGIATAAVGIALFVWICIQTGGWQYLNVMAGDQAVITITVAAAQGINLAIAAVFCALFFGITTYIMKRRLNLA
ncbi:MAG: hypothetical protein GX033_04315 [Firmicutes bacterium]|nr:hypothetical protein [Bacillota bacterium]